MVTGKLLYWKKRAKYDEVYKVVTLTKQEIKLIQKWRRMPHLLAMILDIIE